MPSDVSCLIVARNEEKMLPGLLDSVAPYVREVILVDGESGDRTRERATQAGADVYTRPPKGYPEADRLYGISKCRGEWVLILDADERPSTFLLDRLEGLASATITNGYRIPRRNYYDQRHSKRTWGINYPDYQLRLFRKSAVTLPGGIHEHLAVSGNVADLKDELYIMHLSPGLYDLWRPHNKWIKQAIDTTPAEGFFHHLLLAPASAAYFAFNAVRDGAWRDKWTGAKAVLLLARYRYLVHMGLALKSLEGKA